MKKVVIAILVVLLCLVVIRVATGGLVIGGVSLGGYKYDHADRYTAGGTRISGRVDALDVSWVSGRVTVERYDGDEILVSETANRTLKADEELRWWLDGDKLYVKFAASGYRGVNRLDKQLTIQVPQSWTADQLTISAVSAAVEADVYDVETITLNTVSGAMDVTAREAGEISANTVSGGLHVTVGKARSIIVCSVSGSAVVEAERLDKLDASNVSGKVRICLPERVGFIADVSSVSGDVKGSMPVQHEGKDRYVAGGKQCRIDVETVSGGVQLDVLDN